MDKVKAEPLVIFSEPSGNVRLYWRWWHGKKAYVAEQLALIWAGDGTATIMNLGGRPCPA